MILRTTERVMPSAKRTKLSADRLISLYEEPPQEEITIDEFETFALDRLQLLRGIESLKTRNIKGEEYTAKLKQLEEKYMPLKGMNVELNKSGYTSQQRKDQISHFILRLAYCRTEDLRRWFLSHECDLLKYRLDHLKGNELSEFMASRGISYELLSADEKEERKDKLVGLAGIKEGNYQTSSIYSVPFVEALSLVSKREVYVEGGKAYVPLKQLVSTVVIKFRAILSKSLSEAGIRFHQISGDTRIEPLLQNMNKQYAGQDFSEGGHAAADRLTPAMVEEAAQYNMPLCMKHLHNSLKLDHKLKHWGRLQYGLFLKGAGMQMEDALAFWESHFSRIVQHDEFNKKYAYSFRHMYGKEGARKNYTPYSCMKIIMGTPPEAGAHHGCPYRHMPEGQLSSLLNSLKIGSADVNEIMRLTRSSNYQLACQHHFDVTHPGHLQMDLKASDSGAVSNHPNLWYQTSVQYHRAKAGTTAKTSSEPLSQPVDSSEPMEA
mmetsp:Transcript_16242/g.24464  ORF Transcript_16242/g.24464 Transcript_16242/m.24464 type:complete len:492 (-) Transcript_16242:202-1677(-)